jgi:PAS domain S-box-containing protein
MTMSATPGGRALGASKAVAFAGSSAAAWVLVTAGSRRYPVPVSTEPGEAGFRALVEQIPAVTYVVTDDHPPVALYVSPQAERILGYPEESWFQDPEFWIRLVHPDDHDTVREISLASDETGVFRGEYRVVAADGSVLWIRDEAVRVRGADGNTFWRGVLIDITAFKLVEQGLRASEAKYRALIEQLPAVIYLDSHEPRARTLYISPNVSEVLGRSPEWFFANPGVWPSVVHEDDRERTFEAWRISSETSVPFTEDYRWMRPDGTWLWVRDSAVPIWDEAKTRPLFWQGVILDVTERRLAEEAARRSEERYQALVEGIPAVIYEMGRDDERRTLYVSPQVEKVLGYTRKEWLEQPDIWTELLHPDDREIELAAHDLHNETGEPWSREYRLIADDGRFVWVRDQAVLIRDETGGPPFWQGVMLDITQLKELENDLRRVNDELEFRVLARTAELGEANEMMSLEIGERKYVENRLRQAEERYRLLVENIPAVAYIWEVEPWAEDEPPRYYTSPQVEQILGYTAQEWNEDPFWRGRVHPHDRQRVFAATMRSEATGDPFEQEYRYLARDGRIVWVLDQARLIARDRKGQPKLFQGVFLDITARKSAEDKAAEAEAKYRLLAEKGPVIAYTMDRGKPTGRPQRITYISPQIERLLGYRTAEWMEDPELFPRILHPDDHDRVTSISQSLDVTGDPWSVDYRLIARDGHIVWMHDEGLVATRDEAGRPATFHGIMLDITERTEAETLLREAEERYRGLVEGMPVMPWTEVVDPDGRSKITFVGPQVESILGYRPEELTTEFDHFRRMLHPDDVERVMAISDHCNDTGEPWDVVYRAIARDGRVVWMHSVGAVASSENGRVVWQGVTLDVTAQHARAGLPDEHETATEPLI